MKAIFTFGACALTIGIKSGARTRGGIVGRGDPEHTLAVALRVEDMGGVEEIAQSLEKLPRQLWLEARSREAKSGSFHAPTRRE